METTLKTRLTRYLKIAGILILVGITFIWLAVQGYALQWTGFGNPIENSTQSKTLWDWMDLLLMPLILAGGVLLLNRSRHESERQRTDEQSAVQLGIALDNRREAAFQTYIDRMTELLQKEKLSKFSPEEVRNVAKLRTFSVLRGLDVRRKGSVLLFLKDSGLIQRDAVIDLCGAELSGTALPFADLSRVNLGDADLSGADLRGTNLKKTFMSDANLSGADLSGANLSGADLYEADLSGSNLNQTVLSKANLTGADLRGCRLNEADLRDADLSGANLNVGDLVGANLRGTNLSGAKLLGADLREADLSQADLSGTEITETEWEKAKSLEGTTMPDGTKHD